jgi:hypothetical protein
MTPPILLKAIVLWFAILLLAILNGALREKVLMPALGSFSGLIASGSMLGICIFLVALAAAPWYGRLASREWLLVGAFWLLLTLAFEFSFGRFVQQKSWAELFEAYTFHGGNLWPAVLVVTLISPWLAAKCRGLV